jgi:hypothetical protein
MIREREFLSIGTFARHTAGLAVREIAADTAGRTAVASAIVVNAQGMIGHPSNFTPLAQSTVRQRLRLGYQPYATLLRTGDYQRSFGWAHSGPRTTDAGSSSPLALFHELGGKLPGKPPKRSVLVDPTIKRDVILFKLFAKTYFLIIDP